MMTHQIKSKKTEITMTKFEIPSQVADLLQTAVFHNLIDELDVYSLAIKHGNDWCGLANELCEYSYAQRHWDPNGRQSAIVKAADAVKNILK